MKLHPREQIVRDAKIDLGRVITEWLERHDLTSSEEIMVVCSEMFGMITGTMKYAIREERHGNVETPGGIESKDSAGSGNHGVPERSARHRNGGDRSDPRGVQD